MTSSLNIACVQVTPDRDRTVGTSRSVAAIHFATAAGANLEALPEYAAQLHSGRRVIAALGLTHITHSIVIDPSGTIVMEAADVSGGFHAELDLSKADVARSRIPSSFHDRAFAVDIVNAVTQQP